MEISMLTHPTHERLITLGLTGMAKALEEQRRSPDLDALSFEERVGLLVDREAAERDTKRLTTRLKFAALRQSACVEDIDWRTPRGIDRAVFARLIGGDWVDRNENLLITGATGLGKSWIACALGHKACRDNRSVQYHRVPRLFEALALARGDGRYGRLLKSLGRVQLLILDDWGLSILNPPERRDLLEILDDRHGRASTIVTSQIPVELWHDIIGDPTLGDAIPLLRQQFRQQLVMPDPNAHAGKARRKPLGRTFPPPDRAPGMLGQIERQTFGRDQIGFVATPRIVQRLAFPPWSGAGWPYQYFRLNAGDIGHSQRCHAGAQPGVNSIGGVHQCDPAGQAGLARPPYLLERDLRLGLEADIRRHTCLLPTRSIFGPLLRQIQPVGHRQAGVVVCNRQRYGHLTIGLLAELPAILMLDAHRMLSLFGEARIVDDPRLDRPVLLHRGQHHLAHLGQHFLIRPGRDTDKVKQRLVLRRRPCRSRLRRHRLHTLALSRQHQPRAIVAQRANPIGVPEHARKPRHIRRKSCFGRPFASRIHVSTSLPNPESSQIVDSRIRSVRPSDSVRLVRPRSRNEARHWRSNRRPATPLLPP